MKKHIIKAIENLNSAAKTWPCDEENFVPYAPRHVKGWEVVNIDLVRGQFEPILFVYFWDGEYSSVRLNDET